jgi:hypothetical protein
MPPMKPSVFHIIAGTECRNPFVDAIPRKTSGAVVYVLDMLETPFVKIGSTSNIKSRLVSYQTGSPFKIEIAFIARPKLGGCHVASERAAHEILSAYRARGEWFCVDVDTAINAVRAAI